MGVLLSNVTVASLVIMPEVALAETIACDLAGTAIRFEIDRTQFAPAIDQNEPERRRVTTVQMDGATFRAEPIMIDDVRGFWAQDPSGADVMMVMQPDGSAIYANPTAGTRLTGSCQVLQ